MTEPIMLILLIPVILYLVWSFNKEKKKTNVFYLVFTLRAVAVVLLIFALTTPFLMQREKEEQVLFLIDRSASMQANETEILEFIENSLQYQKDHHLIGMYSFAESFQTEALLSSHLSDVPQLTEMTSIGETNISQALQITSGFIDPNKATRIVLFTDGNETKGKMEEELYQITSDRLSVDVVKMSDTYSVHDVMITNLKTPETSHIGAKQSIEIEVETTKDQQITIELYENDEMIHSEAVDVTEGENIFSFDHMATKEGLITYEAKIKAENDAIIENNRMKSLTKIESPPHVLIVQGDQGNPNIEHSLTHNVMTTTIHAKELPSTLNSYLRYEAIVFDNVPGFYVGEEKMDIIHQAVKNFGTGFMMTGGEMSYGLGGYFQTPIEQLLPVEMEVTGKHKLPTLGLVIVMDRSGSMSGSKMSLAKEAAARSVELLNEGDTLGVIAFDDRPWEIIPTDVMNDKEEAVNKILSITDGGGTEIYSSLKKAYEDLQPLDLQRKHIILLTDGQENSKRDYHDMIENGLSNGITLSTVAIGTDADGQLLKQMSEMASGRFYDVLDENMIPSILSRETAMISKTYILDEPFIPRVYNQPNWNSLFNDGVPQMNAYIATTLKQGATLVLDHEREEDPVLAMWNYGLGKSIAYMSDTSGAWSGDFAKWNQWHAFWQENIKQILPKYNDTPYIIQQDGRSFTFIDPNHQANLLKITATNELGEELTIDETLTSSRERTITVDGENGLVFFNIDDGTGTIFNAGKPLPYSEEYRMKEVNMEKLQWLADTTKGQVIEHPDEVFRDMQIKSYSTQPFRQQLIILAMILFFVDITIRRFGLKRISFKRKKKPTAEQDTITDRLKK